MAKVPGTNMLDRAIAAVSPAWAKTRMRDRMSLALAGGYFGGGKGRRPALSGWNPGVNDADADISPDLVDLRAYSRDLARTSALAGGAINTVVTNVVGTGLALQPAPDAAFLGLDEAAAKAWIDHTLREFRMWAESTDCDVTRTQNFYGLQSLGFRAALESGDAFVIPTMAGTGRPYSLAMQMIEADRVCNPGWKADAERLVQGVEFNALGAPLRYHIASRHPGARQRAGMEWTALDAFSPSGRRNVLHIFERRRPGQTRGVPYLASVIEPLKQLTRYSEAEISAAVISAAFAVFVKMDAEAFDSLFDSSDRSAYLKSATKWDGSVPTVGMDSPGKAVNLLPGESIEAPALGRPNSQFDPFVMSVLRQVGVGLELPFEVLVKHFTASYSAARAALLDAWRFFRGRRDFVATVFCQPVYELWLEEAVALGRVRAHGFFADPAWRRAWSGAVWTGDGPGSIDPMKEVNAATERIAQGISTIAAESILHDGVDWETKHRQRVRETQARREAGLDAPAAKVGAGDTAQNDNTAGNGDTPPPAVNPGGRNFPRGGAGFAGAEGILAVDALAGAMAATAEIGAADRSALIAALAAQGKSNSEIAEAIMQLASREQVAPVVTINQGDVHVAPASVVAQMPETAAPTVNAYFEATLPAAEAPVINNQVDVHVPEAAKEDDNRVRRIEIVSMPERKTETKVTRDAEGDITGSRATEKDGE